MRGSLNKPRNKKAAQQALEKSHTREAEGSSFSEGQTPPDHGNQQDDANINAIFLPGVPRDTFDKAKRSKLKPMRGSFDPNQSLIKMKVGVQEGNTSMDAVVVPNILSPDKTKSNSTKGNFERLKLTPSRGGLKSNETQTRVREDGEKGNSNIDAMSLPNMLRFLETEETLLTQLQSKMSAELSRLQVEEHVFLHTLKILGQKRALTNKVQDQQETSSGDQDFIDALNEALTENGESVPSNEDKGEGTSED